MTFSIEAPILNLKVPNMHILQTVLHKFSKRRQGEFESQSTASFIGDHFLDSHGLNVLKD